MEIENADERGCQAGSSRLPRLKQNATGVSYT